MIWDIILVLIGFIFLVYGARVFVDGAASIASNFKVSKIIIGMTIVGFGTNTPELAVAIKSMLANTPDIVIGNVFGCNIINILLILGLGSLIVPLKIKNNTISKEIPLCLLFSTALVFLLLDVPINGSMFNEISRSDGIILLLFFSIFIYYIIMSARKVSTTKDTENPKYTAKKSFMLVFTGLILVITGSNFVVESATSIAEYFNISQKIIAMTIVTFGTALPEIITTIVSARKGEHDILIGNIIGSNIFNICIVIGLQASIFGGIQTSSFNYLDLFMFVIASIVLFFFAKQDHKISRKEGLLMITGFLAYYSILIFT